MQRYPFFGALILIPDIFSHSGLDHNFGHGVGPVFDQPVGITYRT